MHFYSFYINNHSNFEYSTKNLEKIKNKNDKETYVSNFSLNFSDFKVRFFRQLKYLKIIFDSKLTFDAYVNYLKIKSSKRFVIFNAITIFI